MFELGRKLAIGGGTVSAFAFVLVALGERFGQVPTDGASRGRVQGTRLARWIGLAVVVGLLLMAVASI